METLLPSEISIMSPPITSFSLKSFFGLRGCVLWQLTQDWLTARSAQAPYATL
jgi:hypothetical protein